MTGPTCRIAYAADGLHICIVSSCRCESVDENRMTIDHLIINKMAHRIRIAQNRRHYHACATGLTAPLQCGRSGLHITELRIQHLVTGSNRFDTHIVYEGNIGIKIWSSNHKDYILAIFAQIVSLIIVKTYGITLQRHRVGGILQSQGIRYLECRKVCWIGDNTHIQLLHIGGIGFR